jgi:hypothetical protein
MSELKELFCWLLIAFLTEAMVGTHYGPAMVNVRHVATLQVMLKLQSVTVGVLPHGKDRPTGYGQLGMESRDKEFESGYLKEGSLTGLISFLVR